MWRPKDSFLKLNIWKGDVWVVEDIHGESYVVPEKHANAVQFFEENTKEEKFFILDDIEETLAGTFRHVFDGCGHGHAIHSVELVQDVWYGINSADGYMDRSDWDYSKDRFQLVRSLNEVNGVEEAHKVWDGKQRIHLDENGIVTGFDKYEPELKSEPHIQKLWSADLEEWSERNAKMPPDNLEFDDLDWTLEDGSKIFHTTEDKVLGELVFLEEEDVAEIIRNAIMDPDTICCSDSYQHFLEDVSSLICEHFGGNPFDVRDPDGEGKMEVVIEMNECVPEDGGVFKNYRKAKR